MHSFYSIISGILYAVAWLYSLLLGSLTFGCLTLGYLVLAPNRTYAQEPHLLVENIPHRASIHLLSVLQDSQGFVWIGTDKGLERWDGTAIVRFPENGSRQVFEQPSMNAFAVYAIAEGAADVLWLGTSQGVKRFDRKTGTLRTCGVPNTKSATTVDVRHLLYSRLGVVWAAVEQGLIAYNPQTDGQQLFTQTVQDATNPSTNPNASASASGLNATNLSTTSLSGSKVNRLYEDSRGTLWVGTDGTMLDEFHCEPNKFPVIRRHRVATNSYALFGCEENGAVLLRLTNTDKIDAPDSIGVLQADTQTGTRAITSAILPVQTLVTHFDTDGRITIHGLDAGGYVWLSVEGLSDKVQSGLYYVNRYADRLPAHPVVEGLVTAFYRTNAGAVWVGVNGKTGSNVVQVVPTGMTRYMANTASAIPKNAPHSALNQSLSDSVVTALFQDNRGVLWFGTTNGLNRFDGTRNNGTQWKQYLTQRALSQNTPTPQKSPTDMNGDSRARGGSQGAFIIHAITETEDGDLLLGTNKGVWRYNRRRDQCFPAPEFTRHVPNASVLHIHAQSRAAKDVWLYSIERGLKRLGTDGRLLGTYGTSNDSTGIVFEPVSVLFEDSRGRLWVGDDGGLNAWQPTTKSFQRFASSGVASLAENDLGNIVIGFRSGAVGIYNPTTNRFEERQYAMGSAITALCVERSRLIDNRSFHWVMDVHDILWRLPSDSHNGFGTRILDNKDITGTAARAATTTFIGNRGVHYQTPTGKMFFSCENGVLGFAPDSVRLSLNNPPTASIVATAVSINGALVFHQLVQGDTVALRVGDALALTVTALNKPEHRYRHRESDQPYRFMIGGVDTTWSATGDDGAIRYAQLPAGTYTLTVMRANSPLVRANSAEMNATAINSAETATSSSMTIVVIVHPKWWQTWQLKAALLGLGACVIGGLGIWRLRLVRAADIARASEAMAHYERKHAELLAERANNENERLERDKEHLHREKQQLVMHITDLQLQTLYLQMNPHFLFNALYALESLIIQQRTDVARQYLRMITQFLRSVVEQSDNATVSVTETINFLHLYVRIEQIRMNMVFDYTVKCEELQTIGHARIPAMLIQPYVENAVKHGLSLLADYSTDGRQGNLHVMLSRVTENEAENKTENPPSDGTQGFIQCVIEDNGIGRQKSREIHRQTNMQANNEEYLSRATRVNAARLEILNRLNLQTRSVVYEDITDGNGNATGTRVTLIIPIISTILLKELS